VGGRFAPSSWRQNEYPSFAISRHRSRPRLVIRKNIVTPFSGCGTHVKKLARDVIPLARRNGVLPRTNEINEPLVQQLSHDSLRQGKALAHGLVGKHPVGRPPDVEYRGHIVIGHFQKSIEVEVLKLVVAAGHPHILPRTHPVAVPADGGRLISIHVACRSDPSYDFLAITISSGSPGPDGLLSQSPKTFSTENPNEVRDCLRNSSLRNRRAKGETSSS
jgi:hypothetical protein